MEWPTRVPRIYQRTRRQITRRSVQTGRLESCEKRGSEKTNHHNHHQNHCDSETSNHHQNHCDSETSITQTDSKNGPGERVTGVFAWSTRNDSKDSINRSTLPFLAFDEKGRPALYGDPILHKKLGLADSYRVVTGPTGVFHKSYDPSKVQPKFFKTHDSGSVLQYWVCFTAWCGGRQNPVAFREPVPAE